MQLLTDVLKSLPGIGTSHRAADALKLGVQLDNHYQIWCHERFHADGTRCDLPEDTSGMWPDSIPRGRTAAEFWDILTARPFLLPARYFHFGIMSVECPLWHHVSEKWKMDFHNLVVTVGRNELLDRTFTAPGADVLWYVGLIGAGTGTLAITAATNAVTGTTTAFAAADVGSDIIIVGAGAAAADLLTTVAGQTTTTALTTTANAGTTVTVAPYAIEPRPADTMASKSFNEATPYSNATRPAWTRNGAAAAGAMSNSASKASFAVNATGRAFGAFMATNSTKGGTTGTLYGGGTDTVNGSRNVLSGDTINVQIDLSVTAS